MVRGRDSRQDYGPGLRFILYFRDIEKLLCRDGSKEQICIIFENIVYLY